MEHLFANLLLNSIQAMSAKSGGVIEIRVKRVGKRAVIEVRDSGPGVKEENLDKMFEPFVGFRHEGFGLGLFSVRRIANEHGGDVKAASTLGVGTTITVTLQAAPTEP
ncbi:ATP-binding protein [bacterium]|nr:MAG: ATP-binding protein [bacterium]